VTVAALKTHLVKALSKRKQAEQARRKQIGPEFERRRVATQTSAAAQSAGRVPGKAASQPKPGGNQP